MLDEKEKHRMIINQILRKAVEYGWKACSSGWSKEEALREYERQVIEQVKKEEETEKRGV